MHANEGTTVTTKTLCRMVHRTTYPSFLRPNIQTFSLCSRYRVSGRRKILKAVPGTNVTDKGRDMDGSAGTSGWICPKTTRQLFQADGFRSGTGEGFSCPQRSAGDESRRSSAAAGPAKREEQRGQDVVVVIPVICHIEIMEMELELGIRPSQFNGNV